MSDTESMRSKILWLLIITLVVAGAGCAWLKGKNGDLASIIPTGPSQVDFAGMNSEDAAKALNFVSGSQLEIRQTYLGQGAKAADEAAGDNKDDVRIVSIERFAPMNYANISWKLSYATTGSSTEPVMASDDGSESTEKQTVKGKLQNVDLKRSHRLDLPGYWPSAEVNLNDSSAIWLSKDVFDELSKNKISTVFYGILSSDLFGSMSASKDFSAAISALTERVLLAEKTTDPDFMRADNELSDWTLKVNGKDVAVQVIKAHTWYGEIVVLNNPQNPLILKFSFNPAIADGIKNLKGGELLATILGYEVTRIENVQ